MIVDLSTAAPADVDAGTGIPAAAPVGTEDAEAPGAPGAPKAGEAPEEPGAPEAVYGESTGWPGMDVPCC